jgi:hypothetical protein
MAGVPGEVPETQDDEPGDAPLVLSAKEEAFCRYYGDPESETYSNGTASAKKAGFGQPHSAQWKLRRRLRVIARLKEFQDAACADLGKVMSDIEHTRRKALEKGDLAVAARCSELQGKRLGLFWERSTMSFSEEESTRRREYSEAEKIEAAKLSRLLLAGTLSEGDMIEGAAKASEASETKPAERAGKEEGG